jgi:hypothetical protein
VKLLPQRESRPFGWPVSDYSGSLNRKGCIAKSAEAGVEVPFRYCKVDPWTVNIGAVKGWLEHCKTHHGDTCNDDAVAEPIPFFRLIDCRSRSVVILDPVPEYLALSYVWGPPTPGDKFHEDGKVLVHVPGIIEDAIQMTLRLGYTYLWVDRYCIYQNDLEKKMQQINTMDLVYQCAQITLIAVCNDLPLGLPGAGRTSRTPQPTLEDDGQLFLCTLPDPLDEIKSSTWMTRGWTFQEALYSRRRLFFTEHQVFMECHALAYSEVISESEDAMIERSKQDKTHRAFPRQKIGDSLSTQPWTILRRIDEYTQRNLTYESDILNGILSVFRPRRVDAQGHQRHLTHLWGVPVLHFPDKDVTIEEGFVQGLCWRMTPKAARRPTFPSWSWTGWRGNVLGYMRDYEIGFKQPYEIDVAVELVDGSVLSLQAYEELLAAPRSTTLAPTISPFLHLDAWAIQVRAQYRVSNGYDDRWIVIIAHDKEIYECSIDWLTDNRQTSGAKFDERLNNKLFEGIIIGNVDSPTQTADTVHLAPLLIVVADASISGTSERVGLVNFEEVGIYLRGDQREGMRRPDRRLDIAPIFQSRRRKKFRLC